MFPNYVCQRKPPPLRDAVVPGALIQLKFGDGDGPNLCRVKKVDVSSTHGVPIQSLDGIYIKDMVYKVSQYRA